MKKVILVFPQTSALADFIINNNISNAEVTSAENSLKANLTDQQIAVACTEHGAVPQEIRAPFKYDE